MAELEATMTVQEFADWQRFSLVHPFPAELTDMHGAMLAAVLVNINRDPKSAPVEVSDFMILRERKREPVEVTEAEKMRAALTTTGG